jgi:hypothetical protein
MDILTKQLQQTADSNISDSSAPTNERGSTTTEAAIQSLDISGKDAAKSSRVSLPLLNSSGNDKRTPAFIWLNLLYSSTCHSILLALYYLVSLSP